MEEKKGRGRPRKKLEQVQDENTVKRGRGRPRKTSVNEEAVQSQNEIEKEKALSPKKQELYDYHQSILALAKDTFGITPQENCKCHMCGQVKKTSDFFRSYSLKDIGNINSAGERHVSICRICCKKIFNYLFEKHGNIHDALNEICQMLDLYFNDELYESTVTLHESRKGTQVEFKFDWLTDYITTLGRSRSVGMTYMDSPSIKNSEYTGMQIEDNYNDTDIYLNYPVEFEGWSKDDLANYDYVLEVYHYDPFENETIGDRRKLYYNLAGLSTEDILDDFAKANAAIDTCRSMVRLEKLNNLRIKLEKVDDPDIQSIKQVTDLQKAERQNIALQGKEHGFTQKYNMNKSQGAGTFTGITKAMDDNMFEDAILNAYDIKTSNAMQMAAEASWKAIFGQLNISESEFSEVVKNQRETIMKLRAQLDETKENLRLANVAIKKRQLEDKLAEEEGISS